MHRLLTGKATKEKPPDKATKKRSYFRKSTQFNSIHSALQRKKKKQIKSKTPKDQKKSEGNSQESAIRNVDLKIGIQDKYKHIFENTSFILSMVKFSFFSSCKETLATIVSLNLIISSIASRIVGRCA